MALAANGAGAFYLGEWKTDPAVVAPWWAEAHPPDPSEMKQQVGKTMVIASSGITGPRAFACRGPVYQVKDYPADWLFHSEIGEMHLRDKSVDPAKIAAKLGFKGSSWKVLVTGCANELEIHFVNPVTAEIGLNNYIYILKTKIVAATPLADESA